MHHVTNLLDEMEMEVGKHVGVSVSLSSSRKKFTTLQTSFFDHRLLEFLDLDLLVFFSP